MDKISALILAGGYGSRLRRLYPDTPKSLIEISDCSLIEQQFKKLTAAKVTNVHLALGHGHKKFKKQLDAWSRIYKLNITYHVEDRPSGTNQAIYRSLNWLDENFIILYGDTFIEIDLQAMINAFFRTKSDIISVVHPSTHPLDADLVSLESNRIRSIFGYPHFEPYKVTI